MGFRAKFENAEKALTFNDVLLLPGWTTLEPNEADVMTNVTKDVKINIPLIGKPHGHSNRSRRWQSP